MAVRVRSRFATSLKNNSGSAMVETLPLLVIFVVLLGFGLGFFGIVHTAIMNSMASRTYAFETFRNRSDLTIFRDSDTNVNNDPQFSQVHARFHAVNDEHINPATQTGLYATARQLTFAPSTAPPKAQGSGSGGSSSSPILAHNSGIFGIAPRNQSLGVSPAWVMVGYGICLDANCGDGAE